MADASRARVADARARLGEGQLVRRASLRPLPPPLRLHPRFDVIPEIKPASPSAGRLAPTGPGGGDALIARARRYAQAGAAAISVLTEPSAFGGSLILLEGLALATTIPVLRKDFLVDPYQVAEARAAGAGGVLLILRLVDDTRLGEMIAACAECRLYALLEAFDELDLERAAAAATRAAGLGVTALVGVNSRDLQTLRVDADRLRRLRPRIPSEFVAVAESGIGTPAAARAAAALGYEAALVGTALMRAARPGSLARRLIAAGRAGAADRAGARRGGSEDRCASA
jgi:indole-3-glycerol phosphate synthase